MTSNEVYALVLSLLEVKGVQSDRNSVTQHAHVQICQCCHKNFEVRGTSGEEIRTLPWRVNNASESTEKFAVTLVSRKSYCVTSGGTKDMLY